MFFSDGHNGSFPQHAPGSKILANLKGLLDTPVGSQRSGLQLVNHKHFRAWINLYQWRTGWDCGLEQIIQMILLSLSIEIYGPGHFWGQDTMQSHVAWLHLCDNIPTNWWTLDLREKERLRSVAFWQSSLESNTEIAGDTSGQSWSALQEPSSNRRYPLSLMHKYFERKNSGQALKSWLAHHSDEISIEKSQYLQGCQFLSSPLSQFLYFPPHTTKHD